MKLTSMLSIFFLLTFLLISVNMTSAIANYCGDGVCTTYPQAYSEADANSDMYCPADCGILTTSSWCQRTYNLATPTSCPTYQAPICDKSPPLAITTLDQSGTQDIGYWILFLILGFGLGYYAKKRRMI
jgi:hypothetical protein